MKKINRKRKELEEAIGQDFMEAGAEEWFEMSALMQSVYHWGLRNIPAKEIDRILAYHKKFK